VTDSKGVVLLKGIWTTGLRNVKRFADPLQRQGFHIIPFDYPYLFFEETWLKPERDRQRGLALKERIGDRKPHLIAHSNGCRIAALAMEQGAKFDKVIFIAPAWSSKKPFPEHAFNEMYVVHSRFDLTLAIGGLLPKHEFGYLGLSGYRGPADARIANIDASPCLHMHYFKEKSNLPIWQRFASDVFADRNAVAHLPHRVTLSEESPSTNL
jgi:pimeloyl-ACP methyl ester carboxylesterase